MSDQEIIKFFGNIVYDATVGMGIREWGFGSATKVTFENMTVTSYATSYLSGMVGSWLAFFVEDVKTGVGPISDAHVNSVMVFSDGGSGLVGANVSNAEFWNIWLTKGAHPAVSLRDPRLEEIQFTTNVTVVNVWDNPNATATAAPPGYRILARCTKAGLRRLRWD